LGWKFWALASSVLLAASASAQPIGRFLTDQLPQPVGFVLDETGFRADALGADRVQFLQPVSALAAIRRTPWLGEYDTHGAGGGPISVRVNHRAPGFELSFPGPWGLRIDSLSPPILSNFEGSYAPDVPSSPASWTVLTFDRPQPPLIIGQLSGEQQAIVSGRPGSWVVQGSAEEPQTIRIGLPLGFESFSGRDVEGLGRLVQRIRRMEAPWTQPAPRLVSESVELSDDSVLVRWTFDRAGALIPPALILAKAGGYPIQLTGEVMGQESWTREGPQAFAPGAVIEARLPRRSNPAGRPLTQAPGDAFGLAGSLGARGEGLLAAIEAREKGQPATDAGALAIFAGRTMDGARLRGESLEEARMAAVAGACLAGPEAAMQGALARAGVAAAIGLNRGLIRRGLPPGPRAPEPGILRALYEADEEARLWVLALQSPVRVFSLGAWTAEKREDGWALRWTPPEGPNIPGVVSLPAGIAAAGLSNAEVELKPSAEGRQRLTIRPIQPGASEVLLKGQLDLPLSPTAKSTL
jgi:hypothetical protein